MRSKRLTVAALLVFLSVRTLAKSPGSEGWLSADPAHAWSFPADLYAHHRQKTEWWYFTGTLAAAEDPSQRFGYQLTFFRVGVTPHPLPLDSAWASGSLVMAHLAVTDVKNLRHVFSEVLFRSMPLLAGFGTPPDPLLVFAHAPAGTDGMWKLSRGFGPAMSFHLSACDDAKGLVVDLEARAERPPLFEGPNGYSRKSERPGYASLYVSFTRLATQGTMVVGGHRYRVQGTSWMDREFGSSELAPAQVGWDWWGLRLNDGRDLMLYLLRRADGTADHKMATLLGKDGKVHFLGPDEWSVLARSRFTSLSTQTTYPSSWEVEIPKEGIRLRVEPMVKDAENVSSLVPGLAYFEGPVRMVNSDGSEAGLGYVELTGYGKRARPPI